MGSSFNALEKALIEAMKDNREIGHFYEELMKSELLCIEVSGNEQSVDFYKRVRVMEKIKNYIYLPFHLIIHSKRCYQKRRLRSLNFLIYCKR